MNRLLPAKVNCRHFFHPPDLAFVWPAKDVFLKYHKNFHSNCLCDLWSHWTIQPGLRVGHFPGTLLIFPKQGSFICWVLFHFSSSTDSQERKRSTRRQLIFSFGYLQKRMREKPGWIVTFEATTVEWISYN